MHRYVIKQDYTKYPLALFVFIAESMRIAWRGMSSWGCG